MFHKILSFYNRFFAVWVILFGVIAYFFPAPFIALKKYNELFFGLTMFGIGAVLSVHDFERILQKPIIVLIGCCAQFTIMPLGAYAISRIFGLPPENNCWADTYRLCARCHGQQRNVLYRKS